MLSALGLALPGLYPLLQRPQQRAEHVVSGEALAEQQALHGVVVRQQRYHVLEQKALAILQQLGCTVHLGNSLGFNVFTSHAKIHARTTNVINNATLTLDENHA